MTLGEAEKIIGHKGAELKGQTLYGALVAKPGEVVYYWQNKDGSNMTAATVNGRITDTSETDLH